jgi:XTP/dITP diphosphohydrolase
MLEIIIGSNNQHKVKEIKKILAGLDIRFLSLDRFDVHTVKETGKSYRANALKKAKELAQATGHIVLADDSGIEVKVLNGRPGIYSARYAGNKSTAQENNTKLLRALAGLPQRQRRAQYRCVVVLAAPHRVLAITDGVCNGFITECYRGRAGFGYDPLFLIPKYGKTFGELSSVIKNRISHRARALNKLKGNLLRLGKRRGTGLICRVS